ncbi:MAG: helix-hairpin-helix domain-containing protein [Bacillota bacterium]|nr:helix-hairpin-helix domain-containing protein [Bacillota bacterium]
MFDLSRRQRFVASVLIVAFGVGGVLLAARRPGAGEVVVTAGPGPSSGGERAEAAERQEPAGRSLAGGQVTVHVCGAVMTPGVYTLPAGSRVADAVRLAGGLAPGACMELVNMAAVLSDAAQVYIPARQAKGPEPDPASSSRAAAGVGSASPRPGGGASSQGGDACDTKAGVQTRVNINTAGLAELDSLPGIGLALAGRIIEHRNTRGRFERPEDLMNVSGIGPAKYEALKDLITVY